MPIVSSYNVSLMFVFGSPSWFFLLSMPYGGRCAHAVHCTAPSRRCRRMNCIRMRTSRCKPDNGTQRGRWAEGGNMHVRSSSHLSLEHVCQLPVFLFPVFAVESRILRFRAPVLACCAMSAFGTLAELQWCGESVKHYGSFHTPLAVWTADNGRFSDGCRGSPKTR